MSHIDIINYTTKLFQGPSFKIRKDAIIYDHRHRIGYCQIPKVNLNLFCSQFLFPQNSKLKKFKINHLLNDKVRWLNGKESVLNLQVLGSNPGNSCFKSNLYVIVVLWNHMWQKITRTLYLLFEYGKVMLK